MTRAMFAAVALLCLAGSAFATYTHYGAPFRLPAPLGGQFVKAYVVTATNNITSDVVAIGVSWTVGFLNNAKVLQPLNYATIPTIDINKPFAWNGTDIVLSFPEGAPLPYTSVVLTYSPSGYPVGGKSPSFLGVYTTPLWSVRFIIANTTTKKWDSVYNPVNQGPCLGSNFDVFNISEQPVAAKCFPTQAYANIGDNIFGLGVRLHDLQAPEWLPSPGHVFDTTFLYGTFNGTISYLNPMVSVDFLSALMKASRDGQTRLFNIKSAPKAFPVDMLMPDIYQLKVVNGQTIVLELKAKKSYLTKIPAGDCVVSKTNIAAKDSFYPAFGNPSVDRNCPFPVPSITRR